MAPKISQWFLTFPQCPVDRVVLLDHVKTLDTVVYYVIASELHKDGNAHLHAYVKFVDGVTAKNRMSFDFEFEGKKYHGNYQACRSCKAVIDYCCKEDRYISNFNLKQWKDKKGKSAVTVKTLKEKTVQSALEDGDISFHQARQYQYARQLLEEPYEHHDVRGIWIHGKSGVGKSHLARAHIKARGVPFYNSQQNKWFDGYNREKIILFDDFDMSGAMLSQKLKLWADEYACTAEIKGSSVQLAHDELIFTSQYTIEEIWPEDAELREALNRRFKKIFLTSDRSQHPNPSTLKRSADQAMTPSGRLETLISKTNHIFGSLPFPMKPRRRKTSTNPCVEAWRKSRESITPIDQEEENDSTSIVVTLLEKANHDLIKLIPNPI